MGDGVANLQSYRELKVWQRAMELVEEVYRLTKAFPADERYGLTLQMRRASVSIPSNIAEGYCRKHRGDYLRYLSIAAGSRGELETELIIAGRLHYITKADSELCWNLLQETSKMLTRLNETLS